MTTHPLHPVRSEKGVALIIVLLLLVVMMGLTTGLTLSGQTEIAMASNELSYAGARAAAEAGINRAMEKIMANTTTNLLATGVVPGIGNGPFTLGAYEYSFEILDDDNPALYAAPLSAMQLTQMGEQGNPALNSNAYLILRATGTGPRGTTLTVSRVLQSVMTPNITTSTATVLSNPAILVNGNLSMDGVNQVLGSQGNVHANGNITKSGSSGRVAGKLTASGTLTAGTFRADGTQGGGFPVIQVPDVKASDYAGLADWILTDTGTILRAGDNVQCGTKSGPTCPTGWTHSGGGNWSASGSMPSSATYYVKGSATMNGTGKSTLTAVSVIAEGNITLTGNGQFKPENPSKVQFVTNGDLSMGVDADDPLNVDGQILVREQFKIHGNSEFQGRVIVQDKDGATNAYNSSTGQGRRGSSMLSSNQMDGTMTVTYNGSLGDIVTTIVTTLAAPPTYTNNFSGWMEQ
ncbi:MAG: hypothetical protein ABI024_00030 [Vicinamibacterales bacterium]